MLGRLFLLACVLQYAIAGSDKRIAIVGEGVIGLSTATALKELDPDVQITIFHDQPFEEILSSHIAGLFRIDNGTYKIYGKDTFDRLAFLWRTYGGISGVQLVSGHILSDNLTSLNLQEDYYGDIVYNFRFLDQREMNSQFMLKDNNSHAIHYTAFTSEGGRYCPWMKKELQKMGVNFVQRSVNNLNELAEDGFEIVINCAGIKGGEVAGDDNSVIPIKGLLLKVDAPWQKHFLYRNFDIFTIPVIDGVFVGTIKQKGVSSTNVTEEEVNQVFNKYCELQPAMKQVKPTVHYVGLRPGRDQIRLEGQRRITDSGKKYLAIHNYGHGGNGFTLGYGTGLHAARIALGKDLAMYKRIDCNNPQSIEERQQCFQDAEKARLEKAKSRLRL